MRCELCGCEEFDVIDGSFMTSDERCKDCGQRYSFDEGILICLTEDQKKILLDYNRS